MKTTVDGVFVEVSGGDIPEAEVRQYIDYLRCKHKRKELEAVHITVDGEYVDLRFWFAPQPFERIRRITGYLVGDMSRWNNAKQAEERDRVKHI